MSNFRALALARARGGKKNNNKYGNKKVKVDGKVFDSKKEAIHYCELKMLERAGAIKGLELQKTFELIPAQFEEIPTGEIYKRGENKGKPKFKKVCVEQSVTYKADFYYIENGKKVVEDTKSEATKTKDYIIKRKLMLYLYGIRIKEI